MTSEHFHMIGIGGVGMSGLAAVLAEKGCRVSGSDLKLSPTTDRLSSLGVEVFQGHAAANVGDADVVVASAAVPPNNPELVIAREKGLPILSRAQLLGMMMEGTCGVAVAGTHGKTTTTSMLADVLVAGGLDPTILIGGDLERLQGNARLGRGEVFLTEACEAFSSFLELHPTIGIVTNIEADHLEFYGSLEGVIAAFKQFLSQIQPEGCAILCIDSPHVRELLPSVERRTITYGFSPDADLRAVDADLSSPTPSFRLVHDGADCGRLTLRVPGEHNVQNALAALAAGHELGLSFEAMVEALADFRGAERRFDVLGEESGIMVVDDYAHHPTEIRATLEAARAFNRRVIVVYQPHQYSRTVTFLDEFAESLSLADVVVLTEIFAAREEPMSGVSSSMIGDVIRSRHPDKEVIFIADKEAVAETLLPRLKPGDLVIVMGAGDIRPAGEKLVCLLRSSREGEAPSEPDASVAPLCSAAEASGSDGASPSRDQVTSVQQSTPRIKGRILFDEPMAPYTSFRVGGPADILAVPEDEDDLCALLEWAHADGIPVMVLGGGYNLLVSDKGIRGLVVKLGAGFDRITADGDIITAGASAKLPALVESAADAGLSGLEGLTGVPGTVGGAVYMNAGTRYGYIEDTLQYVRAVGMTGARQQTEAKDLGLAYRSSRIGEKGLIVTEAVFRLCEGSPDEIRALCTKLLENRTLQPCTVGTAGSTFKNPPGEHAGCLIETVGCKGMRVGGAEVSNLHANFLFNVENATASDIRGLIDRVREMVRERCGIDLQTEVQIVGEW